MKKSFRILFLLSVLLLCPLAVMAAKKVGYAKIVDIQGEAMIKRRGGDRQFRAVKGMKLVEGDCLYTKEKCNVSIVLDNDNQLVVGEKSIVDLTQMRKLSKKEASTTVSLKKGSVFSNIKKKLTDRETYQIKTPNAIAGVRGTQFYVNVEQGDTYVNVIEGEVKLENIRAKKSVTAKRGELAKAENISKAYLIKNDSKPDIIRDIKNYFISGMEGKNYHYNGQGNSDKLTGQFQENDYTVSRSFDPTDNSGDDSENQSGRYNEVSVEYTSIPRECIIEVNRVEMNYNHPFAKVRYYDGLHITGRISDSYPSKIFRETLYLYSGGHHYSVRLPLDSSKRSFSIVISKAEMDLSASDVVFMNLD